jgi:hypothetical protein
MLEQNRIEIQKLDSTPLSRSDTLAPKPDSSLPRPWRFVPHYSLESHPNQVEDLLRLCALMNLLCTVFPRLPSAIGLELSRFRFRGGAMGAYSSDCLPDLTALVVPGGLKGMNSRCFGSLR